MSGEPHQVGKQIRISQYRRPTNRRIADSPDSSSSDEDVIAMPRKRPKVYSSSDLSDSTVPSEDEIRSPSSSRHRVARIFSSSSSSMSTDDSSSSTNTLSSDTASSLSSLIGRINYSSAIIKGGKSESKPREELSYCSSSDNDSNAAKCPICLMRFKEQEVGCPDSCDHLFCVHCITEWGKNVNTCPVDRSEFSKVCVRANIGTTHVLRTISIRAAGNARPPTPTPLAPMDNTTCQTCGAGDREATLLLCDGCDHGWHLDCLDPPLAEVPVGQWYCNACREMQLIRRVGERLFLQNHRYTTRQQRHLRRPYANLWSIEPEEPRDDVTAPAPAAQAAAATEGEPTPGTSGGTRGDGVRQRREVTLIAEIRNGVAAAAAAAAPRKKRKQKRRKRKAITSRQNIQVNYQLDEANGRNVDVEATIRSKVRDDRRSYSLQSLRDAYVGRRSKYRRKKKRRARDGGVQTVKKRLAQQLGICNKQPGANLLPNVRSSSSSNNVAASASGIIPPLHLFGQRESLDYFSDTYDDVSGGVPGMLTVRRVDTPPDAAAIPLWKAKADKAAAAAKKRARARVATSTITSGAAAAATTNTNNNTNDILSSILESQLQFHSRHSRLSLNRDGTVQIASTSSTSVVTTIAEDVAAFTAAAAAAAALSGIDDDRFSTRGLIGSTVPSLSSASSLFADDFDDADDVLNYNNTRQQTTAITRPRTVPPLRISLARGIPQIVSSPPTAVNHDTTPPSHKSLPHRCTSTATSATEQTLSPPPAVNRLQLRVEDTPPPHETHCTSTYNSAAVNDIVNVLQEHSDPHIMSTPPLSPPAVNNQLRVEDTPHSSQNPLPSTTSAAVVDIINVQLEYSDPKIMSTPPFHPPFAVNHQLTVEDTPNLTENNPSISTCTAVSDIVELEHSEPQIIYAPPPTAVNSDNTPPTQGTPLFCTSTVRAIADVEQQQEEVVDDVSTSPPDESPAEEEELQQQQQEEEGEGMSPQQQAKLSVTTTDETITTAIVTTTITTAADSPQEQGEGDGDKQGETTNSGNVSGGSDSVGGGNGDSGNAGSTDLVSTTSASGGSAEGGGAGGGDEGGDGNEGNNGNSGNDAYDPEDILNEDDDDDDNDEEDVAKQPPPQPLKEPQHSADDDIYSDIEEPTVSTSQQEPDNSGEDDDDEEKIKEPQAKDSVANNATAIATATNNLVDYEVDDDDDNDLVIDDTKEETSLVSSSTSHNNNVTAAIVDPEDNMAATMERMEQHVRAMLMLVDGDTIDSPKQDTGVHSTCDDDDADRLVLQQQKQDDDDDTDDDGCPNFNIYSSESVKMATNMSDNLHHAPLQPPPAFPFDVDDLNLPSSQEEEEQLMLNDDPVEDIQSPPPANKPSSNLNNLYSDSDEEIVIKIDQPQQQSIENQLSSDLRDMTEDISEEDDDDDDETTTPRQQQQEETTSGAEPRSFTPCLDENNIVVAATTSSNKPAPSCHNDLEQISDEENRNDFSGHLVAELEINAKESELDFSNNKSNDDDDSDDGETSDKQQKRTETSEAAVADESTSKQQKTAKQSAIKAKMNRGAIKKGSFNDRNRTAKVSSFKKLSKNNKDRNYRNDNDSAKKRFRDKSPRDNNRGNNKRDKDKENRRDERKRNKEKRKEIQRYSVRSLIAEKPQTRKDRFGRDDEFRKTKSRSRSKDKQQQQKKDTRLNSASVSPIHRRSRSTTPPPIQQQINQRRSLRSITPQLQQQQGGRSSSIESTRSTNQQYIERMIYSTTAINNDLQPTISRYPPQRSRSRSYTPPGLIAQHSTLVEQLLRTSSVGKAGKKRKGAREKRNSRSRSRAASKKRKKGERRRSRGATEVRDRRRMKRGNSRGRKRERDRSIKRNQRDNRQQQEMASHHHQQQQQQQQQHSPLAHFPYHHQQQQQQQPLTPPPLNRSGQSAVSASRGGGGVGGDYTPPPLRLYEPRPNRHRNISPPPSHLNNSGVGSWTPPRSATHTNPQANAGESESLTVILTNDRNKRKEKRRRDKRVGRRGIVGRRERTPPPSKEVFASGDNILVSVSFNKDQTGSSSTLAPSTGHHLANTAFMMSGTPGTGNTTSNKRKRSGPAGLTPPSAARRKRQLSVTQKPVAIIDLDRSPFHELTPSPRDVIVLSDDEDHLMTTLGDQQRRPGGVVVGVNRGERSSVVSAAAASGTATAATAAAVVGEQSDMMLTTDEDDDDIEDGEVRNSRRSSSNMALNSMCKHHQQVALQQQEQQQQTTSGDKVVGSAEDLTSNLLHISAPIATTSLSTSTAGTAAATSAGEEADSGVSVSATLGGPQIKFNLTAKGGAAAAMQLRSGLANPLHDPDDDDDDDPEDGDDDEEDDEDLDEAQEQQKKKRKKDVSAGDKQMQASQEGGTTPLATVGSAGITAASSAVTLSSTATSADQQVKGSTDAHSSADGGLTSLRGPNTPPNEPPTSPAPSMSPDLQHNTMMMQHHRCPHNHDMDDSERSDDDKDVYDPFDPTKSRSPSPEPNSAKDALARVANHQDLSGGGDAAAPVAAATHPGERGGSHSPPLVALPTQQQPDIQPADSQTPTSSAAAITSSSSSSRHHHHKSSAVMATAAASASSSTSGPHKIMAIIDLTPEDQEEKKATVSSRQSTVSSVARTPLMTPAGKKMAAMAAAAAAEAAQAAQRQQQQQQQQQLQQQQQQQQQQAAASSISSVLNQIVQVASSMFPNSSSQQTKATSSLSSNLTSNSATQQAVNLLSSSVTSSNSSNAPTSHHPHQYLNFLPAPSSLLSLSGPSSMLSSNTAGYSSVVLPTSTSSIQQSTVALQPQQQQQSKINVLSSTILTAAALAAAAVNQPVNVSTAAATAAPTSTLGGGGATSTTTNTTTSLLSTVISNAVAAANANAAEKAATKAANKATKEIDLDSPYSPGSSDYEDLFEPPTELPSSIIKSKLTPSKKKSVFDSLFGGLSPSNKFLGKGMKRAVKKNVFGKTKMVGVKIDEDSLKVMDEVPNSAVEMQVKDKFLKKLNRQERVVEEVKMVLKPHYNKKHITKDEYKDVLRRAVPKICHNKSGEINPKKIQNLVEAYVKKLRQSKKVTSSSSKM